MFVCVEALFCLFELRLYIPVNNFCNALKRYGVKLFYFEQ